MSWCTRAVAEQYHAPSCWVYHSMYVLVQFLLAMIGIVSQPATQYMPPILFGVIRVGVALPLLYLMAIKEKRMSLSWKDQLWLAGNGLLGVTLGQIIAALAVRLVGAGIFGMFVPLVVILTAILSTMLGMEPLSFLKCGGVLLSVGGSIGITLSRQTDYSHNDELGMVVMFLVICGFSIYIISVGRFLERKPIPLYSYFLGASWGLLLALPFAFVEAKEASWVSIPLWVWLAEVFCGVGGSAMAHMLLSWLIKHSSPLLPSMYICMQSIITVIMASVILHEKFTLTIISCMALVICGLIAVVYAKSKEKGTSKRPQEIKCPDSDTEDVERNLLDGELNLPDA